MRAIPTQLLHSPKAASGIEWNTHHLQRCNKYWAGPHLSAIHGTAKLPANKKEKES